MPRLLGKSAWGLGEKAFEAELDRLLERVTVPYDEGPAKDLTATLHRINEAAARADYLQAIRLLGEVEIVVDAPEAPRKPGAARPEDVEQALGDLRRALALWGTPAAREAATALCKEARGAVERGRWDVAWALIEEADERLAVKGP